MGNGIDYSTESELIDPLDETVFAQGLQAGLDRNATELRELTRASATGTTFRGEIERERTLDLGDPRAVGWTFLVNRTDPNLSDIIDAIRPLAEHRGMANPSEPLLFSDEPPEEWFNWLLENYSSLILGQVPHYVLIVGGPDQVPFRFQSLLDSAASVGRVDFATLDDLSAYIEKVVRLEEAADPVVTAEAFCFAPDGGPHDATFFSRRYMVEPLVDRIQNKSGLQTRTLMGEDATKQNFQSALESATPALVYTASHGLGAPSEDFDVQKRLNGAICCQRTGGESSADWLFSADDVPTDEPFLEGAIFFQFACFGYGTPAQSDFSHWLGKPELNTEQDFVAALPKRLLAHSRGPVAFIGHVDLAWLHGFADPDGPHILDRWHPRIEPFARAVDELLQVQPAGLAMGPMNKRYDIGNALLTSTYDRLQRGNIEVTSEFQKRLVDAFITRNDAQNYFVLGDPAVRLRIPTN